MEKQSTNAFPRELWKEFLSKTGLHWRITRQSDFLWDAIVSDRQTGLDLRFAEEGGGYVGEQKEGVTEGTQKILSGAL